MLIERTQNVSDLVPDEARDLRQARSGFQTKLSHIERDRDPAPIPPAGVLGLVRYRSPAGELAAYVTPAPAARARVPAVIWLRGEFTSSIGAVAWAPGEPKNDQSGSAFREAGLAMLYPSLRGGNDNPGAHEGFFGEVDDVIAAAEYLAGLSYVDATRIYLAGHSTGATLALLCAASTTCFRAVFAFGPVPDVSVYDPEHLPFDRSNPREFELRAPVRWLHAIRTPTFVIEGNKRANVSSVLEMANSAHAPAVQYHLVKGADHFSVLQPITRLVARKIKQDSGAEVRISFPDEELHAAMHPH